MTEKITGYALLTIGITLILFSAFNVYFVFTKKIQPIQVFSFSAVSLDLSQSMGVQLPNSKPAEILPANVLNDSANLFAHLLLMGFLAATGQKLASLGVDLLRPIIVKSNKDIELKE